MVFKTTIVGSNPTSPAALLMLILKLHLQKIVDQIQQFTTNLQFSSFFKLYLDMFKINGLDSCDSDNDTEKANKERGLLNKNLTFKVIDFLYLLVLMFSVGFSRNTRNTFLFSIKTQQLNRSNFYIFNNPIDLFSNKQLYLYGLRSCWKHLRLWILPLILSILFVYYSFFLKSLPFSKVFAAYILLGNMFYLLFSGFVFFFKKYQYRLFTSVIQKFWRRTLIIFWAIEGSLFVCFIYLIFNASQEPVHVYDNIQIYKTHFYSWRFFLVKSMLMSILIILTYMLLLSLKWNTFTKTNNLALCVTVILLYTAWLEFYQFFHLMNCYGISNWVYDFSEHLWNLELEFKRTRIVNHYVTIGLIAKFWHIVFAVVFWLFFLLRGIESSRFRYPLLSANIQNFLLVYFMGCLYMYPWFKFSLRKALDMPYFWFFVNNRRLGIFLFFNDIKLYYWGMLEYVTPNIISFDNSFKTSPYYYWHESSSFISNTQFRRHNTRDVFIRSILV